MAVVPRIGAARGWWAQTLAVLVTDCAMRVVRVSKKKKKTISSSGPPKISFESMDVRPGWGSLDDNEHGGMGAGGDGAPSLFICEETAPRWSCHDD